jgi:hypothetical protein
MLRAKAAEIQLGESDQPPISTAASVGASFEKTRRKLL